MWSRQAREEPHAVPACNQARGATLELKELKNGEGAVLRVGPKTFVRVGNPNEHGAQGVVHIFRNKIDRTERVALKIFSDSSDPELRLFRELDAKCGDVLVHGCPVTVRVETASGSDERRKGVLMEAADRTLYDVIHAHENEKTMEYVAGVMNKVCDAVLCIHVNTGKWYTDIKADNILISGDRIMLGDIGSICVDGDNCIHSAKDPISINPSPERLAVVGLAFLAIELMYGLRLAYQYADFVTHTPDSEYKNLAAMIKKRLTTMPDVYGEYREFPIELLSKPTFQDAAMAVAEAGIPDD